ncbi:alpha/beta hydrolase [Herbiconiux sp. VKM Ac-1786]|uniref:alpha/beta fold hydrolase n=1 Tax=Herbiconiux sp. VKM Ac-1786 TaxID=2783824 RepID=UPI00188D6424|nr:alpha/beta hydrolase [Herbiconiux sp. VKM Ac-1786]MBF4573367.1 alpha/beta hydrolase [Herbiconiux sp. VKM Ac-1786]
MTRHDSDDDPPRSGPGSSTLRAFYAPFELVHDPARVGLRRREVRTRVGPVVLHAGERRGDGPATVLLHGAAGSWTTWTPLLLAAAAEGCRPTDIVVLDLPGWGESPLPDRPLSNGRSALTIDAYAGAVRDAVEALGYRSWHLVGHSMGGLIALHLAAREPARTESVVVVSPTGPSVLEAAAHPVRSFTREPAFVCLRAVMSAFSRGGRTASVLLRALDRMHVLRPVVAPLFARPSQIPPGVASALAREVRPEAFSIAARLAAGYDPERWSTITAPVRVLRGRRDAFAAETDDARLAGLLPGSTLTVLPTAGHFAHLEAPFAVLDELGSSVCAGAGG